MQLEGADDPVASHAGDRPPLTSLPSRWPSGSPLQGQEARAHTAMGRSLALADMGGAPWAQPGGATITLGQWPQVGYVGAWVQRVSPYPLLAPPHLTCNNLPDLVGGHHACGGVHAATAAPWPVSAALLTGHAWPAAGGLQTWGVGWPQAGLGGRGYLPNTKQLSVQKGQRSGQDEASKEVRSGDSLLRGGARAYFLCRDPWSRAPRPEREKAQSTASWIPTLEAEVRGRWNIYSLVLKVLGLRLLLLHRGPP